MADTDITTTETTEEKKGGGVAPVVMGAAGTLGGGMIAAKVITDPKRVGENLKTANEEFTKAGEAHAKKLVEVLSDEKNAKIVEDYSKHANAKLEHVDVQGKQILAQQEIINNHFDEKIHTAAPELQGKYHTANIDGEIKALEAGKPTTSKNWQKESFGAQKEAVTTLAATEDFKKLSPAEAKNAIEGAKSKAAAEFIAKKPEPVASFSGTGEDYIKESLDYEKARVEHRTAALNKVEPKLTLIDDVKKAGEAHTKPIADAAKVVENTKAGAKGVEDLIKTESSAVASAGKKVTSLKAMEAIGENKGLWNAVKKPFQVVKHGSVGAKVAIIASAVALGALVYKGTKAITKPKQEETTTSFAQREEQRRSAPSTGQGIA